MGTRETETAEPTNKERKKKILLGVTGSVAAVKAPLIAVRLCASADVKILLTHGGTNFWNKAIDYDPEAWNSFQRCVDQRLVEVIRKL